MSVDIMKTANRIHDLEVMNREIPIEGNEQKVRMCDVFQPAITGYIEDLRELNKYRKKYGKLVNENGKAPTGIAEVTDSLHLPGHKSMSMRLIPD
jgi:hypothetical protein